MQAQCKVCTIDDIKATQSQAQYINAVSPACAGTSLILTARLTGPPTVLQGVSPDFLDIRNWPLKEGIAFDNADINKSFNGGLIRSKKCRVYFDPADK